MSLFRRDSGPDDGRGRRGSSRGGPQRRTPPAVPPGRPFRTLAFWAFVVLLAIVTVRIYQGSFMAPQRLEVSYTRFIQEVDKGNILNLQIVDHNITGELRNESTLRVSGHDVPFKTFKTNIVGEGADLPERVWKSNPGIEIDYAQRRAQLAVAAARVAAGADAVRRLAVHHAPDAGGRKRGAQVRQDACARAAREPAARSRSRTWRAATRPSRNCRK